MNFPIFVPGMDPIETALDARIDRTHACWPRQHERRFRDVLCDSAPLEAFLADRWDFQKEWRPVKWRDEWRAA
jgi:hypothetical protein